jgi:hypothetical protein
LRVTWHPDQRKVVLSHWRDGVCVTSTPVDLSEVPDMITMLVTALGQAANEPNVVEQRVHRRRSVLSAFGQWLRPKLAPVTELHPVRSGPGDHHTPLGG